MCLSVREDIFRTHSRSLPVFRACYLRLWLGPPPTHLRLAASPIAGKGFSSPLKMHYRWGKGEGSAHRGRSQLSTIALLLLLSSWIVVVVRHNNDYALCVQARWCTVVRSGYSSATTTLSQPRSGRSAVSCTTWSSVTCLSMTGSRSSAPSPRSATESLPVPYRYTLTFSDH